MVLLLPTQKHKSKKGCIFIHCTSVRVIVHRSLRAHRLTNCRQWTTHDLDNFHANFHTIVSVTLKHFFFDLFILVNLRQFLLSFLIDLPGDHLTGRKMSEATKTYSQFCSRCRFIHYCFYCDCCHYISSTVTGYNNSDKI